jgi:hypothetical protein
MVKDESICNGGQWFRFGGTIQNVVVSAIFQSFILKILGLKEFKREREREN